jgi:hypothetical protein
LTMVRLKYGYKQSIAGSGYISYNALGSFTYSLQLRTEKGTERKRGQA